VWKLETLSKKLSELLKVTMPRPQRWIRDRQNAKNNVKCKQRINQNAGNLHAAEAPFGIRAEWTRARRCDDDDELRDRPDGTGRDTVYRDSPSSQIASWWSASSRTNPRSPHFVPCYLPY